MKENWKLIVGGLVVILLAFGITYLSQPKKINKHSNIGDINHVEDKFNIYFFWGNGCPHCEELFAFLESIQKDYGKYYNIYAFEVWNNEANHTLMQSFASELNEKVTGVPYIIIGDKSFNGFQEKDKEAIKNTIKEKYENRNTINKFENILKQTTTE